MRYESTCIKFKTENDDTLIEFRIELWEFFIKEYIYYSYTNRNQRNNDSKSLADSTHLS